MIVYWIHKKEHKIETDGYIGVTSQSAKERWRCHKRDNSCCVHLKNAINKYGDSLIYEVVYEGTEKECLALEKKYRPIPSIGWNIKQGGGNSVMHSEESKRKISKKMKVSQIGKGNNFYGKTHSAETKEKIRKVNSGANNPSYGKEAHNCKKVICLDTNVVYSSLTKASKELNINRNSIKFVCKGQRNKAGGLVFAYWDGDDTFADQTFHDLPHFELV